MNRFRSLPNPRPNGAVRTLALLTGVVTLSLTGLAAATDSAPAGASHRFPISIAEAKERAEARFNALDTDHNGQISPAELAAAPKRHWMSRGGGMHHRGHRGMGPEGGTRPSAEQRQAWRDQHKGDLQAMDDDLFKRLDTNGDGRISRSEFGSDKLRDARRASMQARIFARLDKDGSGGLSRDELPNMVSRLEAMDTNHDGMVSREEARAYRQSRHQGADDDQG